MRNILASGRGLLSGWLIAVTIPLLATRTRWPRGRPPDLVLHRESRLRQQALCCCWDHVLPPRRSIFIIMRCPRGSWPIRSQLWGCCMERCAQRVPVPAQMRLPDARPRSCARGADWRGQWLVAGRERLSALMHPAPVAASYLALTVYCSMRPSGMARTTALSFLLLKEMS